MATPNTGPPVITDYYYGGDTAGWNDGTWNELVAASPVPFPHLHNFAPILISNGASNLTFNLCGNGYFYGTISTGVTLYADVLIAECSQFAVGSPTGVEYARVFDGVSTDISDIGTVCFDFTTTYSIPTACEYQAAVALIVVSDEVGSQKFDFSYQLRVSQ
jgi:hypothetical protein